MTATKIFLVTFSVSFLLTGVPMALAGRERLVNERQALAEPPRAPVQVLTHSVEAGVTLSAADVAERQLPAPCADPGALGPGEKAVGRRTRVAIQLGDVLHASQLAAEVAP